MIRLLLLLCATLFITLLLAGRDYGQMRPGLTAARDQVVPAAAAPNPPLHITPAAYVPPPAHSLLPVVLPLVTAPVVEVPVASGSSDGAAPAEISPEVRYVTARAVNVRSGPSTAESVTGRLVSGDTALVLKDTGTGWTHILIEGDGIDGYVATRFLSADAP